MIWLIKTTVHIIVQLKWNIDVISSTYIDSIKESNNEDPTFKIGDILRISKYKNICAKGYVPNWSEEDFVIKMVKNTVPWTNVISDLKGKAIVGMFYEEELQKKIKKSLELKE